VFCCNTTEESYEVKKMKVKGESGEIGDGSIYGEGWDVG
jgi:hypothetical protein